MSKSRTSKGASRVPTSATRGIIRGRVGPDATLSDAFAVLEKETGEVPVMRHPVRNLRGARFHLDPKDGSGYYDLTRVGEHVFVIVGNFAYRHPRIELIPGDGRIQFYFKLSGDLTLGVSRTEPLRLNRPSLLIYKQHAGFDLQEWTAPSVLERCVAITFSPEYLIENFLSSRTGALPELALADRDAGQFKYLRRPLTARMYELASRLVDNPYEGSLRLVHTEAVTLELLCAAVHGFSSLPATPNEEYSDRDLRCLHIARELLMRQLTPAPTIRQVSRAAGMNETALKHGFKAVFGDTLFEFSVRCRMQHALTLLRERCVPVAQIAESVGYSHQTSFATAFRRHFGIRPRDVRAVKPR
ncbi:MAG TPA: AraC family transcriptional regulator [Steroidobacteraceae bacterium]|nr:AraC family transcriptional regulator [Steroidobacteraceae bacterium]